ncbi:MAG: hypothetical protein AAGF86_10045, partial [Pseudomonadota bacterium]
AGRLASLLGTDQLDVAVLSRDDAVAMRGGEGKFAPYGKIPLVLLANLNDYVLIAHERFPTRHAWLVSKTLSETVSASGQAEALEWHPGTQMFLNGKPEPHG